MSSSLRSDLEAAYAAETGEEPPVREDAPEAAEATSSAPADEPAPVEWYNLSREA